METLDKGTQTENPCADCNHVHETEWARKSSEITTLLQTINLREKTIYQLNITNNQLMYEVEILEKKLEEYRDNISRLDDRLSILRENLLPSVRLSLGKSMGSEKELVSNKGLSEQSKHARLKILLWAESHGRDLGRLFRARSLLNCSSESFIFPGAPMEWMVDSYISSYQKGIGDVMVFIGGTNSVSKGFNEGNMARYASSLSRYFLPRK